MSQDLFLFISEHPLKNYSKFTKACQKHLWPLSVIRTLENYLGKHILELYYKVVGYIFYLFFISWDTFLGRHVCSFHSSVIIRFILTCIYNWVLLVIGYVRIVLICQHIQKMYMYEIRIAKRQERMDKERMYLYLYFNARYCTLLFVNRLGLELRLQSKIRFKP